MSTMLINQMNIALQGIALEAQRMQNTAQMLTNATPLPSQSQALEPSPQQPDLQQILSHKGQLINITA